MFAGRMKIITILLIALSGFSYGQETDAERDGEAVVSIEMTESIFQQMEQQWRDTMSWHASMHCKRGKDNCWGDDKQIRYHDVVITDTTDIEGTRVEIYFHIRDRYDHTKAAMSSQQVRSFFLDYEGQLEDYFGHEMSLLSPGEEGMEGWLIAVITISCVLGVALIIAIAVLASKHMKLKKQHEFDEELNKQRVQAGLLPGYVITPDGKINPSYIESDHEKANTSMSGSVVIREPPPAYFNHPIVAAEEKLEGQSGERKSDALAESVPVRVEGSVSVHSNSPREEEEIVPLGYQHLHRASDHSAAVSYESVHL